MKKHFFITLFVFTCWAIGGFAQSTLILPNRLDVPNVATLPTCSATGKGQLVYLTADNKMYFCNGNLWVEMSGSGGSSQWLTSGSNIYNNTANVGIGTANPTEKLHVFGNIKNTGRIDAGGVIEGAGLSTFGALYVNSTSLLQGAVTGSSTGLFYGKLTSNTGMEINDAAGILNFRASSTDKGFMQLSGDNLRVGTYSGNTLGKFIVRTGGVNNFTVNSNGDAGFGTEDPIAKVHIHSGGSNTTLSLQADGAPTLRLYQGTSYASLQYTSNDLRINSAGNKVVLSNVLYADDASNRVGIGTNAPEQKLHVSGKFKVSGTAMTIDDGKITGTATGSTSNLLPVAYGTFNQLGGKVRGTSNISVSRETLSNGVKCFILTVNGVDLNNAVIFATTFNNDQVANSSSAENNIIFIYDDDEGEMVWDDFKVIVYLP